MQKYIAAKKREKGEKSLPDHSTVALVQESGVVEFTENVNACTVKANSKLIAEAADK